MVLALAFFTVLDGLSAFGIPTQGVNFGFIFEWALSLAFVARGATMGIYLTSDSVIISSWFRRYTFKFEQLNRVETEGYRGLLNHNSYSGWGPLYLSLSMITVETKEGDKKSFPGTVASHARARRTRLVIEKAAGLGANVVRERPRPRH